MGASDFINTGRGSSAKEAFYNLRDETRAEYGNRGYTGTIAEKTSFVMIPLPPGEDIGRYAQRLIEEDDPRISDKSGPAGCIDAGNGEFVFFGLART